MKLLMLGWELPPYNSGGLGVACYQMCKHLSLAGVEIDFIVPYFGNHNVPFMRVHSVLPKPKGVKVYESMLGAYESAWFTGGTMRSHQKKYIQFVEDLLESTDYDAIHAHDWLTLEAGMHAKRISNKPLIAHVHATEFDRAGGNTGNPLVHEIEYNGLMMADRIIAVSQFTKNIIVARYGIAADKIEVVHNSIDQSELGELSLETDYVYLQQMKALGYKVVVSLGRLTIQKGLVFLLEAAREVIARDPKVIFVIAGDGDMRDELIEKSAELGIAHNVVFTGFIRGKRWRDTYAIGDMFVMSSVSEPFGLTALEAAAYKNALLLTKQTGAAEVLHNALTFDYWDTHKLADYILAVAHHDSLQHALSENVHYEYRHLSWHSAAQAYHRIYRQLSLQGVTA